MQANTYSDKNELHYSKMHNLYERNQKQVKELLVMINNMENQQIHIALYLYTYRMNKWIMEPIHYTSSSGLSRDDYLSLFLGYNNELKQYYLFYIIQQHKFKHELKYRKELDKYNEIFLISTVGDKVIDYYPIGDKGQNKIKCELNQCVVILNIEEKVNYSGCPNFNFYCSIKAENGDKQVISFDEEEKELLAYHIIDERNQEFVSAMSNISFKNVTDLYASVIKKVDSYNLKEILKDLEIEVYDYLRIKIGGDNTYTVTETRNVSYPIEKIDKYLIDYLKLGTTSYSESAYSSAESMIDSSLITGKYSKKQVEKVKKDLIKHYSKQEHLEWVFNNSDIIADFKKHLFLANFRNTKPLESLFFARDFYKHLEREMGFFKTHVHVDEYATCIERGNCALKNTSWLL